MTAPVIERVDREAAWNSGVVCLPIMVGIDWRERYGAMRDAWIETGTCDNVDGRAWADVIALAKVLASHRQQERERCAGMVEELQARFKCRHERCRRTVPRLGRYTCDPCNTSESPRLDGNCGDCSTATADQAEAGATLARKPAGVVAKGAATGANGGELGALDLPVALGADKHDRVLAPDQNGLALVGEHSVTGEAARFHESDTTGARNQAQAVCETNEPPCDCGHSWADHGGVEAFLSSECDVCSCAEYVPRRRRRRALDGSKL